MSCPFTGRKIEESGGGKGRWKRKAKQGKRKEEMNLVFSLSKLVNLVFSLSYQHGQLFQTYVMHLVKKLFF